MSSKGESSAGSVEKQIPLSADLIPVSRDPNEEDPLTPEKDLETEQEEKTSTPKRISLQQTLPKPTTTSPPTFQPAQQSTRDGGAQGVEGRPIISLAEQLPQPDPSRVQADNVSSSLSDSWNKAEVTSLPSNQQPDEEASRDITPEKATLPVQDSVELVDKFLRMEANFEAVKMDLKDKDKQLLAAMAKNAESLS